MGFNTTVVIHNDSLETIADDPEFGKNLATAVKSLGLYKEGRLIPVSARGDRGGIHCNAAEVVETHHADQIVAVAVGANGAKELGYAGHWSIMDDPVQMLRILADKHGYTLRKKPQRD